MGKRNRAALLPTQLPQLQNLIKRDPKSYEAEFQQQYRHYQSSLSIFCLKPNEEAKEFSELVTFISQVAQCYPTDTAEFPQQLVDLLQQHCVVLNPEVRKSFVQALILLRNKGVLDNTRLLPLFFTLFKCRDKQLRELLYSHIVNDIKNANLKAKNNKLNRSLQSFMFTMLESVKTGNSDENAVAAKKSVDVCIDLYHKNVWNDAKTVNVIAEACFSPVSKIAVTAIRFFLTSNEEKEESEDEDEDIPDLKRMKQASVYTKKTKARSRRLEAAKKKVSKKAKNSKKAESFNFSALHLLNDPQGFAEKLYSKLNAKDERWEIRLLRMNLISRVIGIHQLSLLGFYPYLIKYLQPTQRDVTMVLVSAAQASHTLVPPDALEPVLKAIANNFVTDRVSNEVIAAGLNGIREICARQPLAIDETLLQDLTQYKNHRDKGVLMGARSLIALYREVNPEMLLKKDRGRSATMQLKDGSAPRLQFGAGEGDGSGLKGIELLDEQENQGDEEGDDGWEGWEVDEESSDSDEEGWINVSDDEDMVKIAMSDDEDDEKKKEEKKEKQPLAPGEKKQRRIGKRQLRKLQDTEEISEEQREKLRQETEARREEEEKKREAMLKVASSRILTPADFAKLNELRENQEIEKAAGVKRTNDKSNDDNQIDESVILGARKKAKMDYEARMASIQEGREGREKFGSKKGKERGSTTNREKARKKNFMMIAHKTSVVLKGKRSLVEKQKALRAAINKQKKSKR
ncbi:SDA1-domain-containing protein [Phascolomyces articulosus]|uniref:Protein SDA1 n=1 Tax=Phascolomyces articulosus TaxID=60185 RepID=A0AAD5KA62_9FUNG|nr:SDA1-domain-containing protein [Phascolomyces articulosus]